MNNKHNSDQIYSICWSQLYLFLNSTIFSTILTHCTEIGPLYVTYIQIRSDGKHTSGQGALRRERPGSGNLPLRPETVTIVL